MVPPPSSCAEHAAHASAGPLPILRVLLHLLADAHVDVEELAHAAVQADALALIELGLAVVVGYALAGAGGDKSKWIQGVIHQSSKVFTLQQKARASKRARGGAERPILGRHMWEAHTG